MAADQPTLKRRWTMHIHAALAARTVTAVALVLLACSPGWLVFAGAPPERSHARALFQDADGNPVGVARLTQVANHVRVWVAVHSLPPGFHGFHVHAVGQCTPPDFASAGGHFNPDGEAHPSHAGDMPVLLVDDDGTAAASFKTDRFRVAELFDADGSALIIHVNADNYANIPERYAPQGPDAATLATGDAGGRLACGVIQMGR
jgi:Cu-Zn family superoxide dismutase